MICAPGGERAPRGLRFAAGGGRRFDVRHTVQVFSNSNEIEHFRKLGARRVVARPYSEAHAFQRAHRLFDHSVFVS